MRACWIALIVFASSAAAAQDASQQMMQMQVQQQQQMMPQQSDLINQQQLNQTLNQNLGGYQLGLRSPRLKQSAGKDAGTILIAMQDSSRGASIFYTTDGWTPTPASHRYLGPVMIRTTSIVRAIAIAPGGLRSHVSVLPVTIATRAATSKDATSVQVSQLTAGLKLPLVFTDPVTSRGKKIGDPLPIALARDLFAGGKLLAPKGTPVDAIVTQVDNSHVQGLPGVLSFAVRSIRLSDGESLPLLGVETMEGIDHTQKASALSIIPLGGLAVHGGDAVIAAGTRLQAEVVKPLPNDGSAQLQ